MSGRTKWIVGVIAALAVVALIAWARGRIHQRGDETGAMAQIAPAAAMAAVDVHHG